MNCSHCSQPLRSNAQFCHGCGKPVVQTVVPCPSCGLPLREHANFCQSCGAAANGSVNAPSQQAVATPSVAPAPYNQPLAHYTPQNTLPKCLSCGAVTPWEVEPLVRPIDWIITAVLFFFFGSGLVYLLIVIAVRSNANNRAKICPHCRAQNLWTFQY